MKSRLQSAVSWMSKKLKGDELAAEQAAAETPAAESEAPKAEDSAKIMAFVSTVQTQQAVTVASAPVSIPTPQPKARRMEEVVEAPRRTLSLEDLTTGPEVKVVTRGAKHYGVCPHCEATWNIRERLTHPSFKRADNSKGLTCPGCDKAVGLPPSTDLRKLS